MAARMRVREGVFADIVVVAVCAGPWGGDIGGTFGGVERAWCRAMMAFFSSEVGLVGWLVGWLDGRTVSECGEHFIGCLRGKRARDAYAAREDM